MKQRLKSWRRSLDFLSWALLPHDTFGTCQDLLSAKKVEAVQTQEKELLAIQLQENLAKLQAQKVVLRQPLLW